MAFVFIWILVLATMAHGSLGSVASLAVGGLVLGRSWWVWLARCWWLRSGLLMVGVPGGILWVQLTNIVPYDMHRTQVWVAQTNPFALSYPGDAVGKGWQRLMGSPKIP